MNKIEALSRLTALEGEAKQLRAIIEAPEPGPSLLTEPRPGSGDKYWEINNFGGQLASMSCEALDEHQQRYQHGTIFQTKGLAAAYARAIDTMLRLRHQPGTESPSNKIQATIEVERGDDQSVASIYVTVREDVCNKTRGISPCFDTKEHAQSAIDTIGADRILEMFKTFHHI
ncbi:hypothetical protein [Candidimonas nitroreducens]|uniref:Uncharacterized protein n=1 Tax=Candidimonas nitroreducens TaxID=683354 RepID=A0A225M3J9_9BURK|nr:hypothetical protein [Candidimonas nitroreducens]OWT55252.1 hypothetical protein CEY11_21315 [Candidimonas nitroreducens]